MKRGKRIRKEKGVERKERGNGAEAVERGEGDNEDAMLLL